MTRRLILTVLALLAATGVAEAHAGNGGFSDFGHGFVHPFSGLDHLAVMMAVGLIAARAGGRAAWLLPACFMVVMAAGGAYGLSGALLPFAEIGIAASVVVLGFLALARFRLPTALASGLAAAFALFHGYVHGAEMPLGASALGSGFGFLTASALLIGVGLVLGAGRQRLENARA